VDDVAHNKKVWADSAEEKYSILSDPGAKVIREYGLLHAGGHKDENGLEDIALRTTVYLDENGIELWRRVSANAIDIPTVAEIKEKMEKL
jgi:peroxiredoxin